MPNKHTNFLITPDTKIFDLLRAYPQTGDLLLKLSPAFAKLRNPILLKTVARVTSLRQAAQIGKIPLGDMISQLRSLVGQGEVDIVENTEISTSKPPDWLEETRIIQNFDARGLIESGGHPLNKVLKDIESLAEGDIYRLISPFLPAPLIEIVQSKGYLTYSNEDNNGEVYTYITRK